ncbi:MAG: hypothetical protein ACM3KF_00250 [Acidobacteriota bacterium]
MAKKDQTKFLGIPTTKKMKRILIMIAVVPLLLLIDLFSPFGGHLRFANEWARCGGRPYVRDGFPGGGVHFYSLAPNIALGFGRNNVEKYYCTPIEAERDGLSASGDTWTFPHLEKAGEVHPYSKKPFPKRE